jgi:hypothetical protein
VGQERILMNLDVLLLILCGLGVGVALMVQDIRKRSSNWKRYVTSDKDFERIQKRLSDEDENETK